MANHRMKIDGNPDEEDYSGEGIFIQVQNNDGTWADIATAVFYGNEDCNAEIDKANARTLAASWDLLETCEELLQMIAMEYTGDDDPDRISRAEAAIAKATTA